jgi:hypothetical protein
MRDVSDRGTSCDVFGEVPSYNRLAEHGIPKFQRRALPAPLATQPPADAARVPADVAPTGEALAAKSTADRYSPNCQASAHGTVCR